MQETVIPTLQALADLAEKLQRDLRQRPGAYSHADKATIEQLCWGVKLNAHALEPQPADDILGPLVADGMLGEVIYAKDEAPETWTTADFQCPHCNGRVITNGTIARCITAGCHHVMVRDTPVQPTWTKLDESCPFCVKHRQRGSVMTNGTIKRCIVCGAQSNVKQ